MMSKPQDLSWRLSVAIPASIVADVPHLREKTGKLGSIARACSIFGVREILLYPDDSQRDQKADLALCSEILSFVETPQYLRRRLFGISPNLRFTGVLPPLQTPAHDVPHTMGECRIGDVRDGVVVAGPRGHRCVDAGLEKQFEFESDVPAGTRVTIQVERLRESPRCRIADESKIRIYWGYRVRQTKFRLASLLEREKFDLEIGTSRYGRKLRDVLPELSNSMTKARSIMLAFGSPRNGLAEILKQEGKTPEQIFDYFVNAVPDQQVSTVRTEEALLVSLGALNLIRLGGLP